MKNFNEMTNEEKEIELKFLREASKKGMERLAKLEEEKKAALASFPKMDRGWTYRTDKLTVKKLCGHLLAN